MRKIRNILLVISLLFLSYAFNSEFKFVESIKYIDCNTIRTPFSNNGGFNRDYIAGISGFEWPNGSNNAFLYSSGLWLGAIVDGDTLVAVAGNSYEYSSGFTDNNGNYQGKNDTNYRVYRLDHGLNNNDRTNWPNALLGNSEQGAPVYFDTITSAWKPLDFGSQTMFMSFTDSDTSAHNSSSGSTLPLKADIKMINFANAGNSGPLAHTIFTEYKIINRSNKVWNNFYASIWTDDYPGGGLRKESCDTISQLGIVYLNNNNDPVYGMAPPAMGFLLLKGPTIFTGNNNDTAAYCLNKNKIFRIGYKNLKISSFNWYVNGGYPVGGPQKYNQTFRMLSGLKRDGDPIINPITNQPTKFWYSGDPVTGQGWISNNPGNNRIMVSVGPLNMNPGDTQTIVFAQIIARGNSNLNSITVLRQYAQAVRDYYNSCYTSVPIGIEPVSQNIPDRFELYQNFPNPFNPTTTIKFIVPMDSRLRGNDNNVLNIYNSLGQLIETQCIASLQPGVYEYEFDGSNLASGVYYYSLVVGDASTPLPPAERTGSTRLIQTRKMVLVK
jgi:hypothetical protein